MKRLSVILAVIAIFATSGCAGFGTFTPGAQAVVGFICQPSDLQKAEAAKWLAALDSIQAGVSVAFPPLAIIKASSVMTVLAQGGCFVLAEVEAALILIGDMQAKQVMLKGPALAAAAPTVQAQFPVLWAAVKAKK